MKPNDEYLNALYCDEFKKAMRAEGEIISPLADQSLSKFKKVSFEEKVIDHAISLKSKGFKTRQIKRMMAKKLRVKACEISKILSKSSKFQALESKPISRNEKIEDNETSRAFKPATKNVSFKGRKNMYHCESCGHTLVTIDKDIGTTPFMISCGGHNGCEGGTMKSMMYRVPEYLTPAYEWIKPNINEVNERMKQHVENGGLIIRKIQRN